jgi:hypothetical protein
MAFDNPHIPDINNILAQHGRGYALGGQMRQDNAMASAGQALAQGNQKGAANALFNAGQVQEGMQLEEQFRQAARQADADKLAKAERFNRTLGNMALLADTPEKWNAVINAAKARGLNVDDYADFGTRDWVLSRANMATEALTLELNRRKAETAAAAKAQPRPRALTVNEATKLSEKGVQLENVSRYGETFKDDYAGYGAGGEKVMFTARNLPFLVGPTTENAATWWQDYDRHKNQIRNELFGSALTAAEQEAFEKSDITPNMDPKQIKLNLQRQQEAVQSALRKTARALAASGYPAEAIEQAIGVPLDQLDGPTPQLNKGDRQPGPVQVKSAQEAQELIKAGKLKRGDSFIDENGNPRTVK